MADDHGKPIDKPIFYIAVLSMLIVAIPMILMNKTMGPVITQLYDWVASNVGLLFQWIAIGSMILLGWLAFGKYGSVKLGDPDDTPEFSMTSWIAMLFSAGVGGGLLYWAGIEWAFYYSAPPFGAEPKSVDAIKWATSFGLFHWGFTAWCIYALPTVAMSYAFYKKKIPILRLSAAILGKKAASSPWAKVIDLSFMFGLIGGAGTSLALTTPMVSAGLSELTGIEPGTPLDIFVIVVCVSLFAVSVYLGLEKGIKKLAVANLYLSILFLVFVLVAGPTGFILAMGTQSIGTMFNNVFTMITWTDPVNKTGFVQNWTVFYWAWWLAFAPYVGIFVTRISKGRTIKQIILSMCAFGSFGAWAFFIVLGNYALFLELENILPVAAMVNDGDGFTAIAKVIGSLPLGHIALTIFTLVVIIFVATTYDSASYTLASAATKELHAGENPARWHRLFWAFFLGVLPIGLMFIGGLKVVQSATLLSGLPIAITFIFMSRTLLKWLKKDTHGP